jgi:hypothetical protein
MLTHLSYCGSDHGVQLYDRFRFPLNFSRPDEIYPYTWRAIAFGGPGRPETVLVERLHDGCQRWLSTRLASHYLLYDYHRAQRFNELWGERLRKYRAKTR